MVRENYEEEQKIMEDKAIKDWVKKHPTVPGRTPHNGSPPLTEEEIAHHQEDLRNWINNMPTPTRSPYDDGRG